MPPQNSKHYHVPFGNDANFVNHSGVAAIKIQPIFQNSSSTLARLPRHPSAFTSMCGTDTAGRGALEPPPEGGARTKPYSTENSSSANRILRPRQKNPDQSPWHQGMTRYSRNDYIYIYICIMSVGLQKNRGCTWDSTAKGYSSTNKFVSQVQ